MAVASQYGTLTTCADHNPSSGFAAESTASDHCTNDAEQNTAMEAAAGMVPQGYCKEWNRHQGQPQDLLLSGNRKHCFVAHLTLHYGIQLVHCDGVTDVSIAGAAHCARH